MGGVSVQLTFQIFFLIVGLSCEAGLPIVNYCLFVQTLRNKQE